MRVDSEGSAISNEHFSIVSPFNSVRWPFAPPQRAELQKLLHCAHTFTLPSITLPVHQHNYSVARITHYLCKWYNLHVADKLKHCSSTRGIQLIYWIKRCVLVPFDRNQLRALPRQLRGVIAAEPVITCQ